METKVCKCCGQERPISEFRKQKFGSAQTCQSCITKHITAGKQKKKEDALLAKRAEEARQLRLADFTPRELMVELKRRGYSFRAEYTETHIINSNDL